VTLADSQLNNIEITPLTQNLGARIDGLGDLSRLDDAIKDRLRDAFLTYGVIYLPGQQNLTAEGFVAFASIFGEVRDKLPPRFCLEGSDAVMVLDRRISQPSQNDWHSDMSMQESPPVAAAHLARVAPVVGGDTLFANQRLAYDRLSEGMKRLLGGLRAVHETPSADATPDTHLANVHPVIRTHPADLRKALYVNPMYTTKFADMTAEESRPLLEWLYEHGTRPEFVYRHQWAEGDLVLWDNRWAPHLLVTDYATSQAVMWRVSLRGERPE
jgi:taurine dioxygenase